MNKEVTDLKIRRDKCGRPLELVEIGRMVLFRCWPCVRCVKAERRAVVRAYFGYRRRKLHWRYMIKELYHRYVSIL